MSHRGRTARVTRWGGAGISESAAVTLVARQLVPGGAVLPFTTALGRPGYPVVSWDDEARARRVAMGAGPVLSLREVARLAERGGRDDFPSPLRLVAFIGVGRASRAPRELSGLRTLCRVVSLSDGSESLDEPLLSEFDCLGITLVAVSAAGGVEVLVAGDSGRLPGSDAHPAWVRHREEQMFAVALRGGPTR